MKKNKKQSKYPVSGKQLNSQGPFLWKFNNLILVKKKAENHIYGVILYIHVWKYIYIHLQDKLQLVSLDCGTFGLFSKL